MNEITINLKLMRNFIYIIYEKETFNPKIDFKKILFN